MRAKDEYKFEAKNTEDSIYAGEPTSMPAFRKLLTKAEKKPIILPSWWNDEKRKEFEQFGASSSEVNFSDPACCIEKHDIIEHSNDPLMPMQLRMFAEQVLERPLMGQSSATMLQMQMKWEAGNIYGTHMSLWTYFPNIWILLLGLDCNGYRGIIPWDPTRYWNFAAAEAKCCKW